MMKISTLCLTLLACLICSTDILAKGARPGSHDLIVGRRGYNDVLLYGKTVKKSKGYFPWSTVSEDVQYPLKFRPGRNPIITEIDVMDLDYNDLGGYAYIQKGGINYSNVTIHFKSQKGRGYNFTLTIYGR